MAKKNFNPWEAIKVGSNEIFFIATHVGRFLNIFLLVKLLALKFGTRVIKLKMIL